MTEPRELVLLSKAEKVLTEANTVDEVKDLRDKAVAVKAYAKKAKMGQRIVVEAAAIKLRAERRLGQMLQAIELADAAPGNQYTGPNASADDEPRIYLRDLGITKSDSSRTQRLATLPQEVFDRYLTDNMQAGREPTMAGVLRLAAHGVTTDSRKATALCRANSPIATLVETGTRFSAIYADPPWADMNTRKALRGEADGRLTFEGLCSFPVRDVCSDTAHLHLRATNSTLLHALDLMEAWGFSYGSCLVTIHRPLAPGNYWHEAHAFVLLGVRGRMSFLKADIPSWIECDADQIGSVSTMIRQLIETVSPGPYLQIIGPRAYETSPAWVVCDDPVASQDATRPALQPLMHAGDATETDDGG